MMQGSPHTDLAALLLAWIFMCDRRIPEQLICDKVSRAAANRVAWESLGTSVASLVRGPAWHSTVRLGCFSCAEQPEDINRKDANVNVTSKQRL